MKNNCISPKEPSVARKRKYPRMFLHFLIVSAVVFGLTGLSDTSADRSVTAPDKISFTTSEFVTDATTRQTVVPGFYLGSPVAELAIVDIGKNAARRLRLIQFVDGKWKEERATTLGAGVSFIDVATINGRDRLIAYENGTLKWYDPSTSKEVALVDVAATIELPHPGEIPHVDITHDLNDDGLDDFVVPGKEGFQVLLQRNDGTFDEYFSVGPTTDLSRIIGAEGYRFNPWSQSRIHKIDFNHDGRNDLVYWKKDHFEILQKTADGRYETEIKTLTTKAPFGSDNMSSLADGKMSGRVLHSIADINGDGTGDLVVFALTGKSVSKKKSTYEVYFGKKTAEGRTSFSAKPGMTFQSEGKIQVGMERYDLNNDGQMDLMFTTIDKEYLQNSLWKTLKGFMGDDLKLDLEFYLSDGGSFAKTPDETHGMGLDGELSHREPGSIGLDLALRGGLHEARQTQKEWRRAFKRPLFIGDVSGDGRLDMLIATTPDGMEIFAGATKGRAFSSLSQPVREPMPDNNEYSWLVDLNNDGKQDVLLHDPYYSRREHYDDRKPASDMVNILLAR